MLPYTYTGHDRLQAGAWAFKPGWTKRKERLSCLTPRTGRQKEWLMEESVFWVFISLGRIL